MKVFTIYVVVHAAEVTEHPLPLYMKSTNFAWPKLHDITIFLQESLQLY